MNTVLVIIFVLGIGYLVYFLVFALLLAWLEEQPFEEELWPQEVDSKDNGKT